MTEKTGRKGDGMTRRQFVAAGAAVGVGSVITNVTGANDRLGIGLIGCGGRGNSHIRVWKALKDAGENIDIVAVAAAGAATPISASGRPSKTPVKT